VRARSERYTDSANEWYFWCLRTGRGDRAAAKQLSEQYWASHPAPWTRDQLWYQATEAIISNDLPRAISQLRDLSTWHKRISALLVASALADKLGDTELRDSLFHDVDAQFISFDPYCELSIALRRLLTGGVESWSKSAFEMMITQAEDLHKPYLYYVAGLFHMNHGDKAIAESYLQAAATGFYKDSLGLLMSVHELKSRGLEIAPSRIDVADESIAPQVRLMDDAYVMIDRKHPELAIPLLNQVLQLRDNFIPALKVRAEVYESLEKYDSALADYETIISIDPNIHA
jgi:tetratricopeptide (TPR) repeat protein